MSKKNKSASNWKIALTLEQRGLTEEHIRKFFQMYNALQGHGSNPGVMFQALYAGDRGGINYIMWQDLRREGYIR